MIRLNVGCGPMLKEGYTNIDLFVQHPHVVKAPADNLPYPDNSVDEVFSSHLLEHISHLATMKVLSEWFRVLKPGGIINLVVPDLEWVLRNWLSKPESERWGFYLCTIFGLQIHPGEYHYTGFTVARLNQLLTEIGFTGARAVSSWDPIHEQNSVYASAVKGARATPVAPGTSGHGKTLRFKDKIYKFKT